MPAISREKLSELEAKTEQIRNICIIAHVDHGKTTLSDSLLATNGIISSKVAGKVRYLDSREDEQERGITMKSSAISLYFKVIQQTISLNGSKEASESEYLIHLIDSPGHVDFSGEVSVASRLCDGALILVDVVEGICTQTHAVLKQAWIESVKPVLVLNKIDRLIVELRLTAAEIFVHLSKIVEQANAIMASFKLEERIQEENRLYENEKLGIQSVSDSLKHANLDEDSEAFSPVDGTVIFTSAYDGWAFRLSDFAKIYAAKLGLSEKQVNVGLWGNHSYDAKKKCITNTNQTAKTLFVQLIMENICSVYGAIVLEPNQEKIEKIIKSLQLKISPYELKTKDTKNTARSVMSQWLPLSKAVLLSVIDQIPNPKISQDKKLETLFKPFVAIKGSDIENSCRLCRTDTEAPVVAFVAKMVSVPNSWITPLEKRTEEIEEASEKLIGFARIFSGTLKKGRPLYLLGPKYNPSFPDEHVFEITVENVYLIMGRSLDEVEEVPAGNVVGISGLESTVLKYGTLSSTKECPSFGFNQASSVNAVVRVAVEPVNPSEMQMLINGLKLLNQADPAVEILLQETGEHVLLASGELHLERCVRDLKEQFAKIDIQVSAPIVPFRETIVDYSGRKPNECTIEWKSSNELVEMSIKCIPLPNKMVTYLGNIADDLKDILVDTSNRKNDGESGNDVDSKIASIEKQLAKLSERTDLEGIMQKVAAFGPKRVGQNVLIINAYDRKFWLTDKQSRNYEAAIQTGFQVFSQTGPLCAEPLQGVAVIIERLFVKEDDLTDAARASITGSIVTGLKEAGKQAFLKWSPRLLLAMYSCEIQASSEVLGKVYGVVSRRKGRILSEEMKEGMDIFTINCRIPVVESFGFADEIRKRTSGAAQPQLVFSGWEVLDEDPFWVPTTEEELEDLGDKADRENVALKYVNDVRKRKGLFVETKLVEHAEKQRTLKIK